MPQLKGLIPLCMNTPELLGADESDFTDEQAIQLRQQFRTLTPENQIALLEIAKVLNRLQQD